MNDDTVFVEFSDQNKFIELLDRRIDLEYLSQYLAYVYDKLDPVERQLLKDYSIMSINKICQKYNKNHKTIKRKLNKIFKKVKNIIEKDVEINIESFL